MRKKKHTCECHEEATAPQEKVQVRVVERDDDDNATSVSPSGAETERESIFVVAATDGDVSSELARSSSDKL